MKVVIDIPDDDYTSVRCEALYYIGSDRLAQSVTTAFQTAIPYEERPQGEWINHSLENLLWGHNECPFCHKRSNIDASYCQYCGAEMREKVSI